MNKNEQNIIIYNTVDGKASVALYTKDDMVWMNQNQLAELFNTSLIPKRIQQSVVGGFWTHLNIKGG